MSKTFYQCLFLLILSVITAIYIRSSNLSNMEQSWYSGCEEAAMKIEQTQNNGFLYEFCKIRLKFIEKN